MDYVRVVLFVKWRDLLSQIESICLDTVFLMKIKYFSADSAHISGPHLATQVNLHSFVTLQHLTSVVNALKPVGSICLT